VRISLKSFSGVSKRSESLKAAALRPGQIWVPDTRQKGSQTIAGVDPEYSRTIRYKPGCSLALCKRGILTGGNRILTKILWRLLFLL
jgi:hypothetical protein